MKNFPLFLAALALSLAITGCGNDKPDPNAALNQAAQTFQEPTPAAQPAPAAAPVQQPVAQQAAPVQPAVQTPPPSQQIQQAMSDYQAKNYQDAVTRLQRLRATPVMSPQQRIAVNDAIASVMNELYALAAQGDARAAQAVKAAEAMQNQRR